MKQVRFYSTPGCGNCRVMWPWVQAIVPDAEYHTVSAKHMEELNIMAAPTIIIFEDDDEVARLSGSHPRSAVEAFLK